MVLRRRQASVVADRSHHVQEALVCYANSLTTGHEFPLTADLHARTIAGRAASPREHNHVRIAFTYNLQVTSSEEEAEFDTADTVQALQAAMVSLGHQVVPIDVDRPVAELVARLDAVRPDLVFNTAEGRSGRSREAFYPALYEQMGLPYTGSDAWVCTTTLDKQLTKLLVARAGVPTPGWLLVERPEQAEQIDLRCPVIVKPNAEGSSKGITADAVVREPAQVRQRVLDALERYPAGVLVEEFVVGRDVVVPMIEGASPDTGGVLAPGGYRLPSDGGDGLTVYDYAMKHDDSDGVGVVVPAPIPDAVRAELTRLSRIAFETLGIRDLGRIDYRVADDGRIAFLEVNALPSLEPGAALYASAALAGLPEVRDVIGAIIDNAARRHGIATSTAPRRRADSSRHVALVYNLKRTAQHASGNNDDEAEFDSQKTVDAIAEAIASHGHRVTPMEADASLLTRLRSAEPDLAFNIAEGYRGRGRESLVPSLLELLDVEYTGSDAATMALTLDKALAKRIVREAGGRTPGFVVMRSATQKLPADLTFPLIVKPVAEGSSKGVSDASVVEDDEQLRRVVGKVSSRYSAGALVEEYVSGREFTVAVLGGERLRVLPPMEIVFNAEPGARTVYTFAHKLDYTEAVRYEAPAKVDGALGRELHRAARLAFNALGCRDVARIDLRLDAAGRVHFIECNPLPGLSPGWSDLCLIAQGAGLTYEALIGDIMAPALRRLRRREREASKVNA